MKNLLLVIITISFVACFRQISKKPAFILNGQVTITYDYCKGTAPTDEEYASYRTPRICANKKLFIRQGSTNDPTKPILAELISDTYGNFSIQLPKGVYCIVDEKKKDKTLFNKIINNHKDNELAKPCLEDWIKTPDAAFTIDNQDIKISINYNQPCSWNSTPCIGYNGPLPP
jgi:hypothetical protein